MRTFFTTFSKLSTNFKLNIWILLTATNLLCDFRPFVNLLFALKCFAAVTLLSIAIAWGSPKNTASKPKTTKNRFQIESKNYPPTGCCTFLPFIPSLLVLFVYIVLVLLFWRLITILVTTVALTFSLNRSPKQNASFLQTEKFLFCLIALPVSLARSACGNIEWTNVLFLFSCL